jgi:hypothetical protein
MELIQDKAKLTAFITAIGKASIKLDEQIHQALASLLVHIRDHGDTTLLTRLFSVLPKGSRLKSYFDWSETFGPLKVDRSKANFGQVKIKKGWKPEDFNILEAMAIAPWDLVSHNREAKALEFDALVKLVTRQARKSIDAGKFTIEQVRGLSDRVAADLVTIQA